MTIYGKLFRIKDEMHQNIFYIAKYLKMHFEHMSNSSLRELERILREISSEELSSIERDIALKYLRDAYDVILNTRLESHSENMASSLVKSPIMGKVFENVLTADETDSAFVEDSSVKNVPQQSQSLEKEDTLQEEAPVLKEESSSTETESSDFGTALNKTDFGPAFEPEPEQKADLREDESKDETPLVPPAQEHLLEDTPTMTMGQTLFGEVEPIAPKKSRRSVIMSLYGHDARQVQESAHIEQNYEDEVKMQRKEDEKNEQRDLFIDSTDSNMNLPQENSTRVVGESIQTNIIADSIPEKVSVGDEAYGSSLLESISVGESLLLKRELFNGDDALFEASLKLLDTLPTFEDCIIYIEENLDSSKPSVRILTTLLDRKFA